MPKTGSPYNPATVALFGMGYSVRGLAGELEPEVSHTFLSRCLGGHDKLPDAVFVSLIAELGQEDASKLRDLAAESRAIIVKAKGLQTAEARAMSAQRVKARQAGREAKRAEKVAEKAIKKAHKAAEKAAALNALTAGASK